MARIRSIHPDACDSRKLAAVSADAERLFWRLQTHCDDHGRCEDDPRLIWARCGPLVPGWDEATVDRLLDELYQSELIRRYWDGTYQAIEIVGWETYQHPQRKGKTKYGSAPTPVVYTSRTTRGPVSSGGEGSGVGEATVDTAPRPETVDDVGITGPVEVRSFLKAQKASKRKAG